MKCSKWRRDPPAQIGLAQSPESDQQTRIAAIGACGMIGAGEILPEARILAQTGESTPLRLAAVGTIGLIGEVGDVELMESLAAGGDDAVRKAARTAAGRIRGRNAR